jgi:hypothetical protein
MHSQWHRLAAVDAVDARSGRAERVKGTNESPEFACHAFLSKASKKGVVHNSVIRLAPVEEEDAGELTPLHTRLYVGMPCLLFRKSKQGIGSSAHGRKPYW